MLRRTCTCVLPLLATLWGQVEATEFKRYDNIHRIEKRATVTQPPGLQRRKDDICGVGMTLCPSSLDGNCCPDNYSCAKKSCYAATKGPTTCQGKVNYHACGNVYGGGCCPNGYVCQTADRCDPPAGFTAGPSVSYNCPASLYLCPSSLGYGCCPSSMGCAVNQCYSTIPTTATTTYTVTTTYDGTPELLITTATVVQTPTPPPTSVIPVEKDGEQPVLKYFPSTVPKFTPSANSSQQEKGNGSSGLSPVQLGGIIGGAAAFLILAMIITYLFIRHLNWLATTFKQSSESRSAQIRHGVHGTPGPGTEDTGMFPPKATPSPSELLYGSRSSVQAASGSQVDAMVYGNTLGVRMDQNRSWGDTSQPGRQEMAVIGSHTLVGQHQRHRSGDEMRANDENWADQSGRRWTNTSELSSNYGSSGPVSPASIAELDSTPPAAGSPEPCSAHRPPLRRRQRCPDNDISMLTRPSLDHQLRSNDDSARHPEYFVPGQLNAVHEHLHGFYGPPGHTEGETRSEETSPGMS